MAPVAGFRHAHGPLTGSSCPGNAALAEQKNRQALLEADFDRRIAAYQLDRDRKEQVGPPLLGCCVSCTCPVRLL